MAFRSLRRAAALATLTLVGCALFSFDAFCEEPQDAIQKVLTDQVAAWNAGNLDGFMDGYWKSEELSFASGGKLRKGWQTIRDHYAKSYGTTKDFGKLTFSGTQVQMLGDDHAVVIGDWNLAKDGKTQAGNFSLILRRLPEGWRVIHDHTSLLRER